LVIAGGAAEQRVSGSWRLAWLGSALDRERAIDTARRMPRSERAVQAQMRWLEVEAADLVERCWGSISAVAEELVRSKTLSGDQVADRYTLGLPIRPPKMIAPSLGILIFPSLFSGSKYTSPDRPPGI
jgi:hypothetical protein